MMISGISYSVKDNQNSSFFMCSLHKNCSYVKVGFRHDKLYRTGTLRDKYRQVFLGVNRPTISSRWFIGRGSLKNTGNVLSNCLHPFPVVKRFCSGGWRDQRVREPGARDPVQPRLHRQLPDVPDPPRVQDTHLAEGIRKPVKVLHRF